MHRLATLLLLAACGGAPPEPDDDALTATLGPQSLVHGVLGGAHKQLTFAIEGKAGDVIAPDAWPTGTSAVAPTLALLGPPAANGRRAALATGIPRGADARHPAIDGFRLPRSGSYLLKVGIAPGGQGGRFSLRLWMQSSHLPRQEGSQVDLALTPGAAAAAALAAHAMSPHPWTDAEVDGVVSEIRQQQDLRVALSSAQNLLSALASQEATAAQRVRAIDEVSRLIGTPRHFQSLDPRMQGFALWWLGNSDALFFSSAPGPAPQGVDATLAQLVAAWPGAHEDAAGRRVQASVRDGLVYGFQADWGATQADLDGTQVWVDFAREWFDADGNWLAEQSAGASEPDDD